MQPTYTGSSRLKLPYRMLNHLSSNADPTKFWSILDDIMGREEQSEEKQREKHVVWRAGVYYNW